MSEVIEEDRTASEEDSLGEEEEEEDDIHWAEGCYNAKMLHLFKTTKKPINLPKPPQYEPLRKRVDDLSQAIGRRRLELQYLRLLCSKQMATHHPCGLQAYASQGGCPS